MSRGDLPRAGMWGLFLQNSIKVELERWSTIDGLGFKFSPANSLFDLDGEVVGKFTSLPLFVFGQSGLPQNQRIVHVSIVMISLSCSTQLSLPTVQIAAEPLDKRLVKALVNLSLFDLICC